jgi:hypothetical protein
VPKKLLVIGGWRDVVRNGEAGVEVSLILTAAACLTIGVLVLAVLRSV